MIQENELRVNNWVLNAHGSPIRARAREFNFCNEMNPILITPETLEACGFVGIKPHETAIFLLGNFGIALTVKFDGLVIWEEKEIRRHVKHLHQLQNLYFALTGEELPVTITENTKV